MEESIMKTDYNGWKNRQTWSVALWINNSEPLYKTAYDISKWAKETGTTTKLYWRFICKMGLKNERNPDNISYTGSRLDYVALNEMIADMVK
jgi:hypothetical protein